MLVLFKITSFVNLYYVSHKYCSPIHKLRVQDRPVPKYFQQKYFLPKVYFEYGQDLAEGSLAEWSKALVVGTSPKGRGFESHSCQILLFFFTSKEKY